MSIPSSLTPLFSTGSSAAAAGYQVSRSLRFNAPDSAFLSRTPAVAGNRTKWTWAGWVKRSGLGANNYLLEAGASDTAPARFLVRFSSDDTLLVSRGQNSDRITSQVFRDVSAWCHLVIAIDTTQGTPNDRIKIYFNGTQVTTFSSTSNPGQNDNLGINAAAVHAIGRSNIDGVYFNGYLADIWFLDGLTPSTAVVNGVTQLTQLGEFDATTGVWNPKAWDGAALTGNSFHLDFADNSALTSGSNAGIGKDTSGLGNYWNTSGLSVTAGVGNDSLVDSPTNYGTDTSGVGGSVRGNYATLNPLTANSAVLSNGNLRVVNSTNATRNEGTLAVTSGKYYWEGTAVSNMQTNSIGGRIGFCRTSSKSDPEQIEFGIVWHASEGLLRHQSGTFTTVSTGTNYNDGDIVGVGLDADNNIAYFYKNGSLTYTYNFSSFISAGDYSLTPHAWGFFSSTWDYNFGQRAFAYQTPGTNRPAATFLALCTQNLPAPLVANPNTVFDALIWSGDSVNNRKLTTNFGPDLFWAKQRNGVAYHSLNDSVRGPNAILQSNTTSAEQVNSNGYVITFATDGVNVTNGSDINASGRTYVGWAWNAGGTTNPSNQAGSITSQVRANVSAGFSVVTYTGNGTDGATVGHGLGVTPGMIIVKIRESSNGYDHGWIVAHSGLTNYNSLWLNETGAANAGPGRGWINPYGSSTFTLKAGNGGTSLFDNVNQNGKTYVAYCFAPVAGFSSFGSYVGNGSSDGPFVFTGMRPRWVMVKSTTTTSNWMILDTARDTYNVASKELGANRAEEENNAEQFAGNTDINSNGFKLRSSNAEVNQSAATYIYAAFAENPFQYARAR